MHDRNGTPIKPGDIVLVECEVTAVHSSDDFCNADLVSVEKMPGNGEPSHISAINTKQVVLLKTGK